MSQIIEFTVPEEAGCQRLDKTLTEHLPQESRARWQALIKQGMVKSEGIALIKPSEKIKAGAQLVIEIPPIVPSTIEAQNIPLEILFEDEHLLVVNKPAGLTVHPGAGQWDNTLVNALLFHCKDLSGIGGVERPGIIHRLDKNTSGVMVVAKNDKAHRKLAKDFKNRNIIRSYIALCAGVPVPPVGRIQAALGRHPTQRIKMAVVKNGKDAITNYKVLEDFKGAASVIQCKLETGRTHQIRVHMAHKHHPILGDSTYGRARSLRDTSPALDKELQALDRQMLHAQELGFTHPVTGEEVHFQAPAPADFQGLLEMLRSNYL